MATITTEKRTRGFVGWIVVIVFWAFQLLMGSWLVEALSLTAQQFTKATNSYEQAGATIGTGIGVMFILIIWVLGSLILGMMLLFTRGRKVLITREIAA